MPGWVWVQPGVGNPGQPVKSRQFSPRKKNNMTDHWKGNLSDQMPSHPSDIFASSSESTSPSYSSISETLFTSLVLMNPCRLQSPRQRTVQADSAVSLLWTWDSNRHLQLNTCSTATDVAVGQLADEGQSGWWE